MIKFLTQDISNSIDMKKSLFQILLILAISHLTMSCYITNCPWGGKRSVNELGDGSDFEVSRSCRKCANGQGTCFGPRICCGPNIGCLMDTKESIVCKSEDTKSVIPCSPYGKACSKVEYGKCATANLCCNPDQCVSDSNCAYDDDDDYLGENDLDDIQQEIDTKDIERKILKALSSLVDKKGRKEQDLDDKRLQPSHQINFQNDK